MTSKLLNVACMQDFALIFKSVTLMISLLSLSLVFLALVAALQMSIADKITLHRNHETHEMLMAQVCSKNLKRIFQVS